MNGSGWPQSFSANTSCEWLIRVQSNQLILIQPLYVHMATMEECDRSHLLFVDGYKFDTSFNVNHNNNNADMARFCGSSVSYQGDNQIAYLSTSNRILIKFHTNKRFVDPDDRFGFKLSWTAVDSISEEDSPSCPSFPCQYPVCVEYSQGACSKSTLCINGSLVCDGHSDCPFSDFSDERGCAWREMATLSVVSSSVLSLILIIFICTERHRRTRAARLMA
ncbi:hypothetical protein PFISCL1PPCAC_12177, partial [Pristionchus fissidentatus]